MALTDDNSMVMPVQPLYNGGGYSNSGGFGFGGDWAWILLLLLLGGGGFGWGMGGFGGMMGAGMMGGMWGMDYLYPWLNNSQNINDGFREQQLATQVNGIQNAITSGFGDVQLGIAGVNQNICQTGNGIQSAVNQGFASTNLGMCQGFNGVNNSIFGAQTAISQQLNSNELASLNRSFAEQTANMQGFNGVQSQLAQCCCDNRLATADTKYTIATEACATRQTDTQNTQNIIDAQTRGTQAILDKLCALELDNVKSQLAQAQRENVGLQNAVNMATMQASQTAQTAQILAGQAAEIDGVYNRLKNCPVPSMPVYGNTPIFTCQQNQNSGCGCGCGSF